VQVKEISPAVVFLSNLETTTTILNGIERNLKKDVALPKVRSYNITND
tara:strand:+ start:266 stop:409 length:144 start_codon:yes stop_codon:yes gene_type:complete